ncbi:MAG TPA: MazG nucleotide pyrophosphohydrolase domain-containing protein [Anaerolineales bacterium]|nr:MazG nucleotide pyrophosphohydrolase domain-containing protein [Anaerolineales bacterium]
MQGLLSKDHLELKDLQVFHRELDKEKQFDQDIFRNVAYLCGEIGELVSAFRKLRKAKDLSEERDARNQVGEELADRLAYVIKLANYAEVDLQVAYVNKMRQNMNREWHPAIK